MIVIPSNLPILEKENYAAPIFMRGIELRGAVAPMDHLSCTRQQMRCLPNCRHIKCLVHVATCLRHVARHVATC